MGLRAPATVGGGDPVPGFVQPCCGAAVLFSDGIPYGLHPLKPALDSKRVTDGADVLANGCLDRAIGRVFNHLFSARRRLCVLNQGKRAWPIFGAEAAVPLGFDGAV